MKINKTTFLWVIAIIESLIITLSVIFLTIDIHGGFKQPSILVIDIFGSVVDEQYFCKTGGCADQSIVPAVEIVNILKKYEQKKYIKGFILNIDSNGGDSRGSFLVEQQIRSMKKPVVAVVRDQALSAGYSVAAATQRIFTNELANIADIGVINIIGYEGTEGFRKCYISSSTIKTMYYEDCPGFSPLQYAQERNRLIKASKEMAKVIALYRNLPEPYILQFADGNIFKGNEALTLKLVDEIGGIPEAQVWLENQTGMKLELLYLREVEKA